jgi:hypothetical protein
MKDKISVEEYKEIVRTSTVNKKGRIIIAPETTHDKPQGNRKIKNAVKSEVNGVKFDSNLEKSVYECLVQAGIYFVFKEQIELLPSFVWNNKVVRNMVWNPDFTFPAIQVLLDSKGYPDQVFPVKLKLTKNILKTGWHILVVKNKGDIQACIELLRMFINNNIFDDNYKQLLKKFEV